jgi:hypothetical protein
MVEFDRTPADSYESFGKKRKPIPLLLIMVVLGILVRVVLWGAFDNIFDWGLYPIAVHRLGLVWGTGLMMLVSGLICFLLLWIYDKAKVDVLGLEAEKRLLESAVHDDYASFSVKSNYHALFTILVMPIATDAFMTTVRLRPSGTHEMREAQWIIFMTSVLISNVGWGFFTAGWLWLLQFVNQHVRITEDLVVPGILLGATLIWMFFTPFPKKQKR